ncbi:serine/threonine-protein phosphatase [Kitasatospora sp. NBC_01287]|uniref:PP2C family protein-serine/threonine phosphatase n=1 Tax=Kitasatospora sp. NBC_01287 TaxID=2903573 RepID=UPI002256DF72|nr:PP2C family protein-serine/threonine phosphatase [Kitasatospora sp. NBC_01287]MCX4746377.1 serine/threonine-protein phosphatase [Kitasatospora sp. NBC_01287]
MFSFRRASQPLVPAVQGLPRARRRRALAAVDLRDLSWQRRAAPALLGIVAVCVADLSTGKERYLAPLMTVVPSIAALTLSALGVLSVCTVGLAVLIGLNQYDNVTEAHDQRFLFGSMITYAALTLFSAYVAEIRMRRAAAFAAVSSVAEAAQRALLRRPGPEVGPLRLAVRYASAADEARIGGDLYSVLDTPHGTRVVVGDVRGKGLDAVQTAAVVLGAFREAAYDEADLCRVAARVEASVERHVPDGEFTTALFAEARLGGVVELLQYGHVPPLRVAPDGTVAVLEAPDPWVPLGLGRLAPGRPQSWEQPFGSGDVLVFCTDGVVEARRSGGGEFYPLEHRAGALVAGAGGSVAELEAAVGRLYADLLDHTGGDLDDDALLLLVSRVD